MAGIAAGLGVATLGATMGAIVLPIGAIVAMAGTVLPFALLFDKKRSLSDANDAVFQFNANELRMKDLARLHGLQMNMTGEGKATFSAVGGPGHEGFETEGRISGDRMHRGNLSFAVPGLDNEIQGLWFMVTPTKEGEHEDEAVRTIGELFGKLQDKEGRTKETADLMEALMQL